MRHVRFVIAIALVSIGAALMLVASEPRPATTLWVGAHHDAHFRSAVAAQASLWDSLRSSAAVTLASRQSMERTASRAQESSSSLVIRLPFDDRLSLFLAKRTSHAASFEMWND